MLLKRIFIWVFTFRGCTVENASFIQRAFTCLKLSSYMQTINTLRKTHIFLLEPPNENQYSHYIPVQNLYNIY